jgi:hypothetical protein
MDTLGKGLELAPFILSLCSIHTITKLGVFGGLFHKREYNSILVYDPAVLLMVRFMRATSYTRLRARDHYTSSTHWWKRRNRSKFASHYA